MGLDCRVLNAPKPEHKEEFNEIFENYIRHRDSLNDEVVKRYQEISIPAFTNLGAPIVGQDKEADEWVLQFYEKGKQENETEEQFIERNKGYHVVQLVKNDGLPQYVPLGQDPYIFRGKWLRQIEDIIGEEMVHKAYSYQNAEELVVFGGEMMAIGNQYAEANNCEHVSGSRDESFDDGPEFKVHLMKNFARWCLYWGKKGHGMEPDY